MRPPTLQWQCWPSDSDSYRRKYKNRVGRSIGFLWTTLRASGSPQTTAIDNTASQGNDLIDYCGHQHRKYKEQEVTHRTALVSFFWAALKWLWTGQSFWFHQDSSKRCWRGRKKRPFGLSIVMNDGKLTGGKVISYTKIYILAKNTPISAHC